MNEYVWRDLYTVFVLGCKDGQYEILLGDTSLQNGPVIEFINDLNGNGTPELYLSYYGRYFFHTLRILEWNGTEFLSLIKIEGENFTYDGLVTTGWEYSVKDINHDQIQEIIAIDSSPIQLDQILNNDDDILLDRKETITLGWDGKNYVIVSIENNHKEER